MFNIHNPVYSVNDDELKDRLTTIQIRMGLMLDTNDRAEMEEHYAAAMDEIKQMAHDLKLRPLQTVSIVLTDGVGVFDRRSIGINELGWWTVVQ